jgi:hypothetical protein
MQKPSNGTIELQFISRSGSLRAPASSKGSVTPVLDVLLMVPGVILSMLAQGLYHPLDARVPMGLMLSLFLVPVALQMLSFLRKRPSQNMGRWRSLYICSSVALLLLALLLFLNGSMDGSPLNRVRTTVIRKAVISSGKGATRYNLTVSSWQPGKNLENFNVVSSVFDRTVVGKTVTVEVHKGFFDLPWLGSISPE